MADVLLQEVKAEDIDDILDEIEENEQKLVSNQTNKSEQGSNINWDEIIIQIQLNTQLKTYRSL